MENPTKQAESTDLKFLGALEAIIRERLETHSADSYTARLAAQGDSRVAQKVGEEALELVLASVAGSREDQLEEAADLMYHLLLLLATKRLTLADVTAQLESRHRDRNTSAR